MEKVIRVAGDKEGEDGKAKAMVTRMVGKWTVAARKWGMVTATRVVGEQWRWAAATKGAMVIVMVMTVVGNKEGNGNGGKSNGNGNEGGWQATATRVIATRVVGKQQ
jgi:hypothetical protein